MFRFSSFPENALVSSPETFGWALTSGCSEEVKEGALVFLNFGQNLIFWKRNDAFNGGKYISQVERDYLNAF